MKKNPSYFVVSPVTNGPPPPPFLSALNGGYTGRFHLIYPDSQQPVPLSHYVNGPQEIILLPAEQQTNCLSTHSSPQLSYHHPPNITNANMLTYAQAAANRPRRNAASTSETISHPKHNDITNGSGSVLGELTGQKGKPSSPNPDSQQPVPLSHDVNGPQEIILLPAEQQTNCLSTHSSPQLSYHHPPNITNANMLTYAQVAANRPRRNAASTTR